MKKLLAIALLSFILISCDDGDLIVTSFDLEDERLTMCGEGNDRVLYVINNDNIFESISFEFSSSSIVDTLENALTTTVDQEIQIPLGGDNRIIYRTYDSEVGDNYFCSQVPPREPRVLQEYRSTSGGIVKIRTAFDDERFDQDADGDGIPNDEEGFSLEGDHQDSDGDEIPDYLDIDDDNDNVSTSREIVTLANDPTTDGYRDTDEDGVPNYLDPDDDGDGAPTRFEINQDDFEEGRLDPALNVNDEGIPHYLNEAIFTSFEHDEHVSHDINRIYRSVITVENLTFENQDGSGEEISYISYDFGYFVSGNIEFSQTPFEEIEEETEEASEND